MSDRYDSRGVPPNVAPNPLVEAQKPGYCARALWPTGPGKLAWQWRDANGYGWTTDIAKAKVYATEWEATAVVRWISPSEVTTVPRHNGHCREWTVVWSNDETEITKDV